MMLLSVLYGCGFCGGEIATPGVRRFGLLFAGFALFLES